MRRIGYNEWDPKAFLGRINEIADKLLSDFLRIAGAAEREFETKQRERVRLYGADARYDFASYSNFLPIFTSVLEPFLKKHGYQEGLIKTICSAYAKFSEKKASDFVSFIESHIKKPKVNRPDPRYDNLDVVWTLGQQSVTAGVRQLAVTVKTDHHYSWAESKRGQVVTEPGDVLASLLFLRVHRPVDQ